MKKLLSITCVMLLAAGIAVAQDTPPSGEQPAQPAPQQEQQLPQSDQAADQTTIRGCLSGSDNNFTISDQSGQSYKLSGDFSMLSQHVNHEVELTGKLGEVSGAADQSAGEAGAATSGDQKVFEFTNVTMISETCSTGTGEEARPESDTAAAQPESETTAAQTQPDMSAQTTPDASAQATPPATTTTPDASAQTTPPASTDPSVTAQQQEAPPAEAPVAQQPEEQPAEQPATEQEPAATEAQDQAAADEQLPQTATPLPLLALLGFGALATGLWTRKK